VRVLGFGLGHTHVSRRANRRVFTATTVIDVTIRHRRRRAPYAATGGPIVGDRGRPMPTGALTVAIIRYCATYFRCRHHARRCDEA